MTTQRGGDNISWGFGGLLVMLGLILIIILVIMNRPTNPVYNTMKEEETFCSASGCSLPA